MKTILIVDDVGNLRASLKFLLRTNGYDVLGAENGKQCLQLLKKQKADLIVIDLKMPEMDGVELISRIRKQDELKKVPIIIYSGYTEQNITEIIQEKVSEILQKPVNVEKFLTIVEKHIG